MGDGIDDAPSLHAADVGISVDSAVDVAKEAVDLILLEHDLAVIRDGIIEGGRALGNIVKYILTGTSSYFGNMFSMAAASVFLPFFRNRRIPTHPATPAQPSEPSTSLKPGRPIPLFRQPATRSRLGR